MKEQKELIRDSISDLLMDNDIDLSSDISDNTLTFQKAQTINYYDGGALTKAKAKAEKVMNTLLKLYMSDGFISKSEYIQAKVNLDSMTLGKIMNQMEVSEAAIQVLMDNIQMGDINPKLFDALGNLQRTFIDLVKTQTAYIENAELEYKKIAQEKEISADDIIEKDSKNEISSNGLRSSNQRELMQMIRNTVDSSNK
ncbi:MAG: hypothetical protein J6V44_03150 [Methanobrevibacter sp.]|jgi:hypothetical protein|nr:hypothetical protein [Methanobrevibacter sp.]